MVIEIDVLLLQQSTGRWILRSAVLGSDREFEDAKPALEAAVITAQRTANDGRAANVILKEWRKNARLIIAYTTDAPSIAVGPVPEDRPQKT
jgi:hypothetical protein